MSGLWAAFQALLYVALKVSMPSVPSGMCLWDHMELIYRVHNHPPSLASKLLT